MKLGTEDKQKTYVAAGLMVLALGTVYVQFFTGEPAGGSAPAPSARPARAPSAAPPEARATRTLPGRTTSSRRRTARGGEFEPIWQRSHEDEEFDPLEADPTLKTELLARVREMSFTGVERNIFQFTTRKVKVAPPSPDLVKQAQDRQREFEQAQARSKSAAPAKPAPKRAPRITWQYYGFASEAGVAVRRAFLLDGEDVLIAGEGDSLKRGRYKIVRIGLTSIVIEDTEFKEEQTLSLTAPSS